MRIGCLQFSPQVGDVDNNLNRADAVLNKSQGVEGLDLLVLPELAFSGYNFRSLAEISPYLEPSGSGISALWARTTALKWNCNVVVGYPEKVDVTEKWPTSPEFYNSAIIVSKDGETIANYRKSFLYSVDETWALEGQDGFFEGYVEGLGDVAMGICMDLNPYRFEAPWHDFEFAYHVLEVQANLVILTMSWLTRESAHNFSQLPQEPDFQTLEYWVQRLEPLIRKESKEEIIVVLCNRSGTEGDAVYAGTSTVLGIKNGEVNLYGVLGRGVKELLMVDTEKAPFAKLLRANQARKSDAGTTGRRDSIQSLAGSSPNESHKSTSFPSRRTFHPFRDVRHSKDYDDESNGTPIDDDDDDAWEIMSTTASHGSAPSTYSQSGPLLRRNSQPKLGLQIPGGTEFPSPQWQSKGVLGATREKGGISPAVGDHDIPTPTAPSPTPMSVRPIFNVPDNKPPAPGKKDIIPPSINMRSGGGPVKVSRADTPITPPLKSGSRGRTRGPTPISEAPPSPPSDEEGTRTGSSSSKRYASSSKKSKKPACGYSKRSNDTDGNANLHRPRASSLSNQQSRPKSSLSTSMAPAFATAAPEHMTNDAMWEEALRKLNRSDSDITGDSGYDHNDVDDILVGESSSQLEMQAKLPDDVRQQFEHLMHNKDREPSPVPAALPDRPPSTKSRNASITRPQVADPAGLRRMSVSRMSIPIVASPSLFRQESNPQSISRRSESPSYPPLEQQGGNKAIQQFHSRQTSETRFERPHSHIGSQHSGSTATYPPIQNDHSTSSQNPSGTGTWMKQSPRPVSRGRQPYSKVNPTNGITVPSIQWPNGSTSRASDNVGRGRRLSNNRAVESISRSGASSAQSLQSRSMSANSSSSWLFGTPPPTSTHPPLDPGDEIVAMINLIHNDCPVHNSRAPSLEPQAQSQSTQQVRAQSQGQGQGQRQPGSQHGERLPRQRQDTPRTQTPNQHQPQQLLLQQQQPSQTPVAQGSGAETVYEVILPPHIRDMVDSLSSPNSRIRSPMRARDLLKPDRATPKFDPPTPTAMQFDVNDEKKLPASA